MRPSQLNAIQSTRTVKKNPFDAIDLSAAILAAVTASPIAFGLAIGQYFARRSAMVSEALLRAFDLPPALEDSTVVRALLPGSTALLPPSDDEAEDVDGLSGDASTVPAGALGLAAWREALEESPHLLIYGPSKAGKSTIAQAIVAMFGGGSYVVIDPQPNKPGERKWGGIDFITLDEAGDEYGSIKAALARIQAEDDRRRRTMRTETHQPLVVIIDEVLALVGALGTVKNAEAKNEPRMSQFIRTMGYSARHRNIKIVLIGQGKNLADLGLNSGTARNNYALLRVTRNVATNTRSAYIDAGGAEQAIDITRVPELATLATKRARVWLTHRNLETQWTDAEDLLSSLLGETVPETPQREVSKSDDEVSPVVSASEREVSPSFKVSVSPEEAAKIASLLTRNSPSKVAKMLDGFNGRNYAELKAKVDAVVAMLGQASNDTGGDDVPPAFSRAFE
jgi:hypothetical protein